MTFFTLNRKMKMGKKNLQNVGKFSCFYLNKRSFYSSEVQINDTFRPNPILMQNFLKYFSYLVDLFKDFVKFCENKPVVCCCLESCPNNRRSMRFSNVCRSMTMPTRTTRQGALKRIIGCNLGIIVISSQGTKTKTGAFSWELWVEKVCKQTPTTTHGWMDKRWTRISGEWEEKVSK